MPEQKSPDLLKQPVNQLPGIGERMAANFKKLGIFIIQDLLFHLPIRYEDKTQLTPIANLAAGARALVQGRVVFAEMLTKGRRSLICRIEDDTGFIDLRFFHYTFRQQQRLKPGILLACFGEVRYGYAGLEMVHPEYEIVTSGKPPTASHLTPIYPTTEGLSQTTIRKAVQQTLTICHQDPNQIKELLPAAVRNQYQLPSILESMNTLHAPQNRAIAAMIETGTAPALRRLVLEELLTHHLSLKLVKQQAATWQAPAFTITHSTGDDFIKALSFEPTPAQLKVMGEIATDLIRPYPMMRLVQGDVGSGKTVVAAYAALLVLTAGFQVAVMAPTELLAEQHFHNFNEWFQPYQINISLLTGQLKGKSRQQALQALADGAVDIVIGTHALFQDTVEFKQLGLIIIDEQHRFGVHQRLALRAKGQQANYRPHQLVMTATPIPRTLAMLQYADLDISIIDQLPPGRKAVTTSVIPNGRRDEVIARIEHWVSNNKQVYWVCTLIEESEMLQCEAAENTAEYLASALPNIRVALLHGQLKNAEKEAIMQAFKNHEVDLLVATTVIEVGVDVPNASLMVIENPERLGLSQLHQLRGRVGRGKDDSFCILLYQPPLSENAHQRLGILRDSNDGFLVAEKDLQLRGPGEVMGIRQTGQVNFKIADLVRDADILDNIPTIADTLLETSPEAVAPLIVRWLGPNPDYSEV